MVVNGLTHFRSIFHFYTLKNRKTENQKFSNAFRGHKNRTLPSHRLKIEIEMWFQVNVGFLLSKKPWLYLHE